MRWEKERFAVIHRVEKTMREHQMLTSGQTVLIAVSGGRDSLVLLDAMVELAEAFELALRVIHIDHGLRPESEEDASFVLEAARHYGLQASIQKVNISSKGRRGAMGPEEAARQARYDAFAALLTETGAERLATGHTADDRVETLLLRILAGTGPSGLAAITPVRPPYVRPLIDVWRSEIDAYLPFLPCEPRDDPGNLDLSIPRNRIRHRLLPLLASEYNPSIKAALLREAKLLASFNEIVQPDVEEALNNDTIRSRDGIEIDSKALLMRSLAIQRQAIMDILVDLGLDPDFNLIEGVRGLLSACENPRLDLARDLQARKAYDKVIIGGRPRERDIADEEWIIPAEGFYSLAELSLSLNVHGKNYQGEDPRSGGDETHHILLDADKILFPLTLRRIRPGDRFQPLGAPGSRKVQDFMVDIKLPREERPRVLLLESEGRIVWLMGLRMDDRFKVTAETRRIIEIELEYA